MKIVVDKNKCVGCGTCAGIAPEVFTLESDGKAAPISQDPKHAEQAKMAAKMCPVGAITVEE